VIPSSPGGIYPAAALARSLIASISSFVLVDSGIGTNGMFIVVTGKGAGPDIIVSGVAFTSCGVASIVGVDVTNRGFGWDLFCG
jgi:hypothetical protein